MEFILGLSYVAIGLFVGGIVSKFATHEDMGTSEYIFGVIMAITSGLVWPLFTMLLVVILAAVTIVKAGQKTGGWLSVRV